MLYLVKTGCQWRSIPSEFPPWQTVYRYFAAWRRKGVWKRIHYALYRKARVSEGKKRHPTALVIDSQSVKTGKMVAMKTRGFDGGKKVKGRKRNMLTDTLGLLVDVSVTPANMHDTIGAQKVLTKYIQNHKKKSVVQTLFADQGYSGATLARLIHRGAGIRWRA
jgi:putative transposase